MATAFLICEGTLRVTLQCVVAPDGIAAEHPSVPHSNLQVTVVRQSCIIGNLHSQFEESVIQGFAVPRFFVFFLIPFKYNKLI